MALLLMTLRQSVAASHLAQKKKRKRSEAAAMQAAVTRKSSLHRAVDRRDVLIAVAVSKKMTRKSCKTNHAETQFFF